jgi:hypothetical protein
MTTPDTRTTLGGRRRPALALLALLALLGAVTYAVAAPSRPDFSVAAGPSSQTITRTQAATYSVTVTRVNGFTGPVSLSASNLPAGATASWRLNSGSVSTGSITVPATQTTASLIVQTTSATPTGSRTLSITGTSGSLARSTSVTLTVQTTSSTPPPSTDSAAFSIAGTLDRPVGPGISAPLDLRITNPTSGTLKVTNLTTRLTTAKAGCESAENYKVLQYRGAYPVSVPAGASRTLSSLGVATRDLPQVEMLNLPRNQDACKGAALTLSHSGTATK